MALRDRQCAVALRGADLAVMDPSPGLQPQMPPDLPEGASKKVQEAQTVALILYNQQTRGRANMTHTLSLRRQVRAALVGKQ